MPPEQLAAAIRGALKSAVDSGVLAVDVPDQVRDTLGQGEGGHLDVDHPVGCSVLLLQRACVGARITERRERVSGFPELEQRIEVDHAS